MGGVLIACLIMFVFIGLFALFTRAYAAFCYKVLVSDKLEVINHLMDTSEVPRRWRLGLLEQASRKRPSRFADLISAFLRRWYVFRLRSIMRYVKRSSLVKSQDKSDFLLALDEIQAEWEHGDI